MTVQAFNSLRKGEKSDLILLLVLPSHSPTEVLLLCVTGANRTRPNLHQEQMKAILSDQRTEPSLPLEQAHLDRPQWAGLRAGAGTAFSGVHVCAAQAPEDSAWSSISAQARRRRPEYQCLHSGLYLSHAGAEMSPRPLLTRLSAPKRQV